MIYMNLQLFAGDEKTEQPTSKHRSDAREKGQVVQSREINSAVLLILLVVVIKVFGDYLMNAITKVIISPFALFKNPGSIFKINNINLYLQNEFMQLLQIIAPIFACAAIIGFLASFLQVGFLFTTKTLKVDIGRINPLEGFKRVFSVRGLMELAKSIAKLILLGYVGYSYIISMSQSFLSIYSMNLNQILGLVADAVFNIGIRMGAVLLILAAIDYFFQWRQNEKGLKMTKQEIKEENKQSEGNPEIKSKIKQKQRQIAMRRMMQDVPKADVVITNPTHLAVALKYDSESNAAPVVIAKGQDYLAARIKDIARNNNVVIVENKPLARNLYYNVDIGKFVPVELFQAVAEVLAYVYNLRNT